MAKPARRRRSAISAWQPASSCVSEGRAISSQARVSKSDMWFAPSARAKTQLVYLVGKANAYHTIVGNQHRPLDQRRVLAQQQYPLRSRARRLARVRKIAPDGRVTIDQLFEHTQLIFPGDHCFRTDRKCTRLN